MCIYFNKEYQRYNTIPNSGPKIGMNQSDTTKVFESSLEYIANKVNAIQSIKCNPTTYHITLRQLLKLLKLSSKTVEELREIRDDLIVFFVHKTRLSVRPSNFMKQLTAATSVIDVMLCGM